MDNILQHIKDETNLTDAELAEHIADRTGYRYTSQYIYMVRAELRTHSDLFTYRLRDTFPEYFVEQGA